MDIEKGFSVKREKDPRSEISCATPTSIDNFGELSPRKRSSVTPVAHYRNWHTKRVRKRLIHKSGECNVSNINIRKRHQRYLADIFTTLVDIKWRWNLLLFVLAFTLSWMVFAGVWWLICFSHGDFNHAANETWIPCVHNVNDFSTALLFSIETQHTIGYGSRSTTNKCPEAIIVMMIQSCFGVIIQALMTGLVFAKLSRSKKRAETLMFSKRAVICKREGQLCLLLRVGDMRRSHIIQATVRGILIKKHVTQEGEILPMAEFEVPFGTEGGSGSLFLVWPLILEHRINETSPFYGISARDLENESFEVVIILEGVIESTGMTTQARTSYLPCEIWWGHRFERLVAFQKENGQYIIDYSRFNNTVAVECPTASAKQSSGKDSRDVPLWRSTSIGNTSLSNISEESATNSEQILSVTNLESNSETALVQLRANCTDQADCCPTKGDILYGAGDCNGYVSEHL